VSLVGKIKDEFKKAVELNPKEVRYRFSLMQFYVGAPGIMGGSNSKAKEQANEIVKLNPALGHFALAQIAVSEKENPLAEQEFSKAIEANPKNADMYNSFGYFYLNQKRYDEAISKFLKYVEVAPENANSYDSLGEGYMTKGDLDAAITQFKKAIEVDPKFVASIFNLAQCYEKKNMKSEALQFYQQSLNTDPKGNYSKRSEKKIKELSK
jgi:Tfp pilus assembly protein PilF